jgi:hypothetical protein
MPPGVADELHIVVRDARAGALQTPAGRQIDREAPGVSPQPRRGLPRPRRKGSSARIRKGPEPQLATDHGALPGADRVARLRLDDINRGGLARVAAAARSARVLEVEVPVLADDLGAVDRLAEVVADTGLIRLVIVVDR